ncbi:hypothetical protein [Epibacterium ulvae]|uniref:hypothetical protein n=1 Tax=Epibacterium ulvae TaxID=1156985 RepID=UPI002491531D|nr:hypothetical protein [Epibacterium ulvae]
MPVTTIPTFTKAPSRSDAPETFSSDVDRFLNELPTRFDSANQQAEEVNALASTVSDQAAEVATAHGAFQSGVNAAPWVPGDVSAGDVMWSPTNGLPYRAKADFNSTEDPAADPDNWYDLNPAAALVTQAKTSIGVDAYHLAMTYGA